MKIWEYKNIIDNIQKEYIIFKDKNFTVLNLIKKLFNNAKDKLNYQNIYNLLENSNFYFFELHLNDLNLEQKRQKLLKIFKYSKPIILKKEKEYPKRIYFLKCEKIISKINKISCNKIK